MFLRGHLSLFGFSFIFSLCFILFSFLSDNLVGFWVFLELAGLAIIPSLFINPPTETQLFYNSLLHYVVMSGLSSVLLISGIIMANLYWLLLLGFIVKFGIFPFNFWIYHIFSSGSWHFIFLMSVVMKAPILLACYFLQSSACLSFLFIDCGITVLLCSILFWLNSSTWLMVWSHMSISSVVTLMAACICCDLNYCLYIYIYYSVWGLMCIIYFNLLGPHSNVWYNFWLYCFLFLITPLSLPLFYKLCVSLCLFYTSLLFLLTWSIYSFSEQFFLYKLGGDLFNSQLYNSWN